MDDFAERRVDESGSFGKLFFVGVGVGDASLICGVEDFGDGFFDDANASSVGGFGVHAGKSKNSGTPGDNNGSDNADEDEFFLIHMFYVS